MVHLCAHVKPQVPHTALIDKSFVGGGCLMLELVCFWCAILLFGDVWEVGFKKSSCTVCGIILWSTFVLFGAHERCLKSGLYLLFTAHCSFFTYTICPVIIVGGGNISRRDERAGRDKRVQ